ncbi:MAG: response regulator [Terriglobia bacterium]
MISSEFPADNSLLTPSALKRLKPLSILVVDDDPIVRKVLRSVFEKLGMKVVTLGRGVDLRPDLLAKQKVDAVIPDLHLPDEQGPSVRIRDHDKLLVTP